jgi:hypothetical protein
MSLSTHHVTICCPPDQWDLRLPYAGAGVITPCSRSVFLWDFQHTTLICKILIANKVFVILIISEQTILSKKICLLAFYHLHPAWRNEESVYFGVNFVWSWRDDCSIFIECQILFDVFVAELVMISCTIHFTWKHWPTFVNHLLISNNDLLHVVVLTCTSPIGLTISGFRL